MLSLRACPSFLARRSLEIGSHMGTLSFGQLAAPHRQRPTACFTFDSTDHGTWETNWIMEFELAEDS